MGVVEKKWILLRINRRFKHLMRKVILYWMMGMRKVWQVLAKREGHLPRFQVILELLLGFWGTNSGGLR